MFRLVALISADIQPLYLVFSHYVNLSATTTRASECHDIYARFQSHPAIKINFGTN